MFYMHREHHGMSLANYPVGIKMQPPGIFCLRQRLSLFCCCLSGDFCLGGGHNRAS